MNKTEIALITVSSLWVLTLGFTAKCYLSNLKKLKENKEKNEYEQNFDTED